MGNNLLEKFIKRLVELRLVKVNSDLYQEMIEIKEELLEEQK